VGTRKAKRYRYNPETKKMEYVGIVKLAEKVFFDGPRYYENLGEYITGEQHKRDVMEEQGVREAG